MNKTDIEKILFLDIETVPVIYRYEDLHETARDLWDHKWRNLKDITPRDQYDKAGIYAEFAKVICIGVGYFKHGKLHVDAFAGDDESTILKELSALLLSSYNSDSHLLCAHNGKEFDFPFLCRRYLINGLSLPKALHIQGKKPWEVQHLDTMEMWKFGDYKSFSSLNLLAHVFDVPSPKDDMDGSMVGKTYYEEKDLARIRKYCRKDVITLARVYCRFTGLPAPSDDAVIFA